MRLRELKSALDQAVAEERFEDAAAYRDDILALEKSTGGNPV
jgi:protein-arginine kinase activator protein McsA